jgi:hypothetical protein
LERPLLPLRARFSAGHNPCRRAGCSSPRAWCIGWIPRSRRRASPPRFCDASTPATRRLSSPRSVRTVPPSGAGTNHQVDPRCGAGRAACKYVRECRPVGRTSKPAVPLPPLRASSCRWAHLSGPCLRFRKGCFPLPACQLPIGSPPGTSLSANSSIMFALVQLDCVDTAPMDACFAGAPVAVHRLCGGNEGTQSTAPQAPDRPRPHTAALGNL